MTIRNWCRAAAATLALSISVAVFAQERGTPTAGMTGIQETTAEIMLRHRLMPQYEPGQPFITKKEEDGLDRTRLRQNPNAPAVSQWPPLAASSTYQNRDGGPYAPQTAGISFNGVTLSESGYLPPDSTGDVGLTDIFVAANGRFKTFSKTGVLGALNTTPENFFNSVRNGSGISDPRVRYDRLSNRWMVAAINVASANNRIVLAVSNSGTITAGTVWTFFFFQCNTGGTADDTNAFADYPTMGVDNNAIYIGANMFKGNFWGATAWVIRKSSVLGAGPIVFTPFRQICNSAGAGIYTPLGVDNWNSAATEGYLIGVSGNAWSTLVMRRIGTPGGTPTISGNINLTVPTTTQTSTVPALGGPTLSAVDDRLFDAQICHNKITGARTLWTSHHFLVNSAGVANTGGGRHGSRWYEITNLSSTPALVQSGTVYDSAASNIKNYWFPGVTMTGQGHMAMGISYAGTADRAGVAAVGRLRTAALGTTQTPDLVQVSTTAYNAQGSNGQRWGDYSRTVVDPSDDMTCWTFQEWCNATNSWAVRVVQLRAPLPAAPSSVSSTVTQGQSNVNVTVTGTSTAGTEFFDPGAGYPNRIAASVSGTGVTVNSVTFNNPTSITLNLTVAANATTGLRNVTVTNPDGQQATGNNILTVNASSGGPPTITTLSPSSGTAGGPAFTLTVNGTNFTGASVVRWNGSNRTTTFVNNAQLTASISAADIANAGTIPVTVQDGANTSNAVNFTVNNPAPTLTSMTPNTRQAAGGTFTLTVNGTGFVPTSTVRWNGANRTTTYVSATQLTASIPAGDTAFVGNSTVTVFNAAPGGGTTGGLTFTVTPIELAPNALTVLFGNAPIGTVANLAQSDDVKYRINYDRFATRNDPKIRLEIAGTSPATTASRIDWSFESSLVGMSTTQRIEIYNNSTLAWDLLNSALLGPTDTVRSGSITTGAASYVNGSGVVKLRVSCVQAGAGPTVTTTLAIDRVHWTIWP